MKASRLALAAALASIPLTLSTAARAEDADSSLPEIVVRATPDAADATDEAARIPGGAEVVSADRFEDTPVQNIKDILAYVPGVTVQPRMGDDARVSIRGSGLSRAYGARGFTLLIDGVPMNTSDGLVDFFEVDPSAYDYAEVFKGANALRYGANSLGGAINLVTPTGRDEAPRRARHRRRQLRLHQGTGQRRRHLRRVRLVRHRLGPEHRRVPRSQQRQCPARQFQSRLSVLADRRDAFLRHRSIDQTAHPG